MLRVLIVDDTVAKLTAVRAVVTDILGAQVNITEATCLQHLRENLAHAVFDLVILDLNIPRYEGESPEPGIGATIFDWFSVRASDIHRPGYLVGLTAFSEIEEAFTPKFSDEGFALLRYSQSGAEWRARLSKVIAHATAVASQGAAIFRCDLGIITALSHVELEALLKVDGAWTEKRIAGDPTLYFDGCFRETGVEVTVVAASAAKMGMPACTALAMQLIHSCRPRYMAVSERLNPATERRFKTSHYES